MEYAEIKKIMNDMEGSKLAELSIEFPDGTKISLKNAKEENTSAPLYIQSNVSTPQMEKVATIQVNPKEEDDLKVVTSPMVGTFYAKSSPNAMPFAEVGKKVKRGETLCIIEAMKLMNEIEAEEDGEIVEVLVNDGEMVDFGKPLFKMR